MNADVAVIGAGPAGSLAAHLLARGGARVVLFDPSHPREKPCGGGVTGRALEIVTRATGLHCPAVRISTARFVHTSAFASLDLDHAAQRADSGSVVALPDRTLVVASRAAFDGALLTASCRAGATLVADRVRRVARAGDAFRIETASGAVYKTPHVIGADGANSLVRRSLAAAFRRDQLSIATGFFAHGVTSEEVVIELISDPPGYLWSFPRPDHLAVGICAQADAGVAAGALRARAGDWMRRLRLAPEARLEAYSWPIPSLSSDDFEALDPAGEGWSLVGDAAGLVDPITREGIFFALESARFSAEAILSGAMRADRLYVDRVRREIAADLARAARLKAAFFRPGFIHLLISALADSENIRTVMADLVAGTQSYGTLKWRLVKTLEWRLAWQLIVAARGRGELPQ
jgi:geranylgeranyl reductase family protein